MKKLGGSIAGLRKQDERSVFEENGIPAKSAPIICYESVMGEYVSGYTKQGAEVLLIMTQ